MGGAARVAKEEATEADLLDELAEEITRLAAHLHAATSRYLGLVADNRRRGVDPGPGGCSAEHPSPRQRRREEDIPDPILFAAGEEAPGRWSRSGTKRTRW